MKHFYISRLLNNPLFYYVITLLVCFTILGEPNYVKAQDWVENFEFYICQGDTLRAPTPIYPPPALMPIFLPPPPSPPLPAGIEPPFDFIPEPPQILWEPVSCFYSNTKILPDTNWINSGSYLLFPLTNTNYEITYYAIEECLYTNVNHIQVYVQCSAKDNLINPDYPWLAELTNTDGCDFSSIDVYEKDGLNYIFLNNEDGKILYYQDGSIICQTDENLNCIEAYQLTNKIDSWSCDQTITNDPTDEPVRIFNSYSWLTNFVDPANCSGKSVYVYDGDGYEFIIVKTDLAEILLTEEGKVYCMIPADGFSFIDLYDASRIINQWSCEEGVQGKLSNEKVQEKEIQLFPNPAKENVFINLQELAFEQAVISIYDVQGKQVKQSNSAAAFAGIVEMDVSDLEKGIYLVEVQTSYKKSIEKLMVE